MKKKTYIFMLSDKDRKRHEHLIPKLSDLLYKPMTAETAVLPYG